MSIDSASWMFSPFVHFFLDRQKESLKNTAFLPSPTSITGWLKLALKSQPVMDLRLGNNAEFFKDAFCLTKKKCTNGLNIHDALSVDIKISTRIDACCKYVGFGLGH